MIIALDIGLKRIGVAICPDKKTILPSTAILRKNRNQAARDTSQMLKEKNASTLVVGVPLGGASEDEMRRRIEHFCALLDTDLKPVFVDESFSSVDASKLLADGYSKSRDGKLDSLSACEILRRYLCLKNI